MTLPIFNPDDPFALLDYTGAINSLDPVHGLITGRNEFAMGSTALTTVDFDRESKTNHVISSVSPYSDEGVMIGDRTVQNYAMNLLWYRAFGAVTAQDIQNKRRVGSTDMETFQNVVGTKTMDMRKAADETVEYLQFRAMTGALPVGASGSTTTMYDFLGLTASDYTLDMETGDASTNLNIKFDQLKRTINENYKGGHAAGPIDLIIDYDMWEEMLTNTDFLNAYLYFQSTVNPNRDDLVQYHDWGVTAFFEHDGVRIFVYNPTFNLADGSTATVLSSGAGIAMPRNRTGMLQGFYGPSTKVDAANVSGSPFYAFAYMAQNRSKYNLELEFSHLYANMRPEATIALS